MKVLAIGASGKMGRGVVSYFAGDPQVEILGVLDAQKSALKSLAEKYGPAKIKPHPVDVENAEEMQKIMGQYDVAVVTLPNRRLSYKVMETAIDARLDLVDILEEYHRRPDTDQTEGLTLPRGIRSFDDYGEQLHERAVANDVLILDGMGFAPGLSNITAAQGMSLMDKAESVVARVGGIPNRESAARHPLRYMTTWSLDHVLREYRITTQILRGGKKVVVSALADEERFQFNEFGLSEDLECAVTPGMPSFVHTHPELQDFAEKTVRWPGHYLGIRTLLECGMLEEQPVDFNGVKIAPRDFLLKTINPLLVPKEGDADVCVMYVTVTGTKAEEPFKAEYFMWEAADADFSGMARVTAYPAAIGAKLVASGKTALKGIRAPEECILGSNYAWFLDELKMKGITIKEKSGPAQMA